MDDIDHTWPAVVQMRKLKNFKKWACTPYNSSVPPMGLFYTERFGNEYPYLKGLKYFEAMTHSSIFQICCLWLPLFCMTAHQNIHQLNPLLFFTGLGSWTLAEYVLHRCVFHNSFCNQYLPEITFLIHYNHHKQPYDISRVSTPFLLTVPIAMALSKYVSSFFLWLFVCETLAYAYTVSCLLGVCFGYMMYEFVHYMTHSMPPFLSIQQHHLSHHQLCKTKFGLTTRIWDRVFLSK